MWEGRGKRGRGKRTRKKRKREGRITGKAAISKQGRFSIPSPTALFCLAEPDFWDAGKHEGRKA